MLIMPGLLFWTLGNHSEQNDNETVTTAEKLWLGRDVNSNCKVSFWSLTNALFLFYGLTSRTEGNTRHRLLAAAEPVSLHLFIYSE